ncbi:hypothetical protein SUGI_0545780 [Cryptomeria japonica]|nr:hypothetical protein SUGI_0545780 [Cryptomeria japonica]
MASLVDVGCEGNPKNIEAAEVGEGELRLQQIEAELNKARQYLDGQNFFFTTILMMFLFVATTGSNVSNKHWTFNAFSIVFIVGIQTFIFLKAAAMFSGLAFRGKRIFSTAAAGVLMVCYLSAVCLLVKAERWLYKGGLLQTENDALSKMEKTDQRSLALPLRSGKKEQRANQLAFSIGVPTIGTLVGVGKRLLLLGQ